MARVDDISLQIGVRRQLGWPVDDNYLGRLGVYFHHCLIAVLSDRVSEPRMCEKGAPRMSWEAPLLVLQSRRAQLLPFGRSSFQVT